MATMKVKYVGLSTYRALTEEDLRTRGVGMPSLQVSDFQKSSVRAEPIVAHLDPSHDLIWGPFNGYEIVMDVDPDLERVLRGEGHFALSEVKDSGADGEQIAEPEDAQFPGDTVVVNQEGETPQKRRQTRA